MKFLFNSGNLNFLLLLSCSFGMVFLQGCPASDDPEPNPCENISCLNGGTCDDGDCVCQAPFLGTNCDTHYTDAIVGTYYEKPYDYYFAISKLSLEKIAIHNFGNSGMTAIADLSTGGIYKTNTISFYDYQCPEDVQLDGEIELIDANRISESWLSYCDYYSDLQGPSNNWVEKQTNEVCQTAFVDGICDPDLAVFLTGSYTLIQDDIVAVESDHQITITSLGNQQVKISNLMNSGEEVLANIHNFNRLIIRSSDLPISVTSSSGIEVSTDNDHMLGYLHPGGELLTFKAIMYSGYQQSGLLIYQRN
jgi:hypothetical protein